MTYPEKVKSTLWNIIDEMSQSPASFVNNPDKDFIRNRKLNFNKIMQFCISMESGNISHELLKFFEYEPDVPTCSAFCQQRAKLITEAFRHLLLEFNAHFPLNKYKDKYYLIACDGSEFNIARNPDDTDTFYPANGKSTRGFNMIHTISLFDVMSNRYLDVEVQPGRNKNEFQALCNLMDRYSYGGLPIVMCDRGFASYNVFAHAIENGIDFVIRAKDLNVQRLLGVTVLPDSIDTTVEIILTRTKSKKKHLHPEKEEQYRYICKNVTFDYLNQNNIQDEYSMKLRIVRFEVAEGIYENIITSLPADEFPPNEIKKIYYLRWKIETSFRDLKHTIGTGNFHSKKVKYIEQEICSRLILYNFCSIIILRIPIETKGTRHIYQVNFSIAMKICFDFLRKSGLPPDVESLISRYILPIRPGRNYVRQHRFQLPASFSYRYV